MDNIEKNLEEIATLIIDSKIKNFPKEQSWEFVRDNPAILADRAKTQEEDLLYSSFFHKCIDAFEDYQRKLDYSFPETGALENEVGTSKLMNGSVGAVLGFFGGACAGVELNDNAAYGIIIGVVAGIVLGIVKGKWSGKKRYRNQFLSLAEELQKEQLDVFNTIY